MIQPDVSAPPWSLEQLLKRASLLAVLGQRHVLGITGPPGAGKSTLAEAICAELGSSAVCVPMDGFHMPNEDLERLGLADRKGAPETFDAAGFVAMLRRLHDGPNETAYAPAFRRDLDVAVQNAIIVPADVPLVVTEGNYLLLDEGPWADVRALLDEAWYLRSDAERVERLIRRHAEFGKSPDEAREWVYRSDEPNARVVEQTERHADVVIGGLPR